MERAQRPDVRWLTVRGRLPVARRVRARACLLTAAFRV
jgi:hypothetical protein